jgi:hypothetical protein
MLSIRLSRKPDTGLAYYIISYVNVQGISFSHIIHYFGIKS